MSASTVLRLGLGSTAKDLLLLGFGIGAAVVVPVVAIHDLASQPRTHNLPHQPRTFNLAHQPRTYQVPNT